MFYETEKGILYNENCVKTMWDMKPKSVDLVVTSPPYDDLRDYKGYDFDFKAVAVGLFRIIKPGGIVVWVVGDATIMGSETGSSFQQAMYFKEIGFRLHDTMIYQKRGGPPSSENQKRYYAAFEYMFVLTRDKAPNVFNPIKKRGRYANRLNTQSSRRNKEGVVKKLKDYTVPEDRIIDNIWLYDIGFNKSTKDKVAFNHPAIFPEGLAKDHILTWTNEGQLVYDPMMGSGTTAKMCELTNRQWIGSEESLEYCGYIKERLESTATVKFERGKELRKSFFGV